MSSRLSILHKLVVGLTAVFTPLAAFAYVGPGAGITAIGSVLALLVGVVLAIVGFIWYPLKRFLRSRSGKAAGENLAEKSPVDETRPGE